MKLKFMPKEERFFELFEAGRGERSEGGDSAAGVCAKPATARRS